MRNECTGSKQQRITGQKRRNHKTGFGKNNEEKDEVRPTLILLCDFNQVFINMKDKIYQSFNQFQCVAFIFSKVKI